jgi:uncharacterized protein
MDFTPRSAPYLRQDSDGLRLIATRSSHGEITQFPPAVALHGDERIEEIALGPEGTIYSFTTVHAGAVQKPYHLAMVDFEADVRVFGRVLARSAPLAIGATVRVVPFEFPDGTPDYAFETV